MINYTGYNQKWNVGVDDGASREIVEEMNKESDCLDAGEHSHLWVTGYIDYW